MEREIKHTEIGDIPVDWKFQTFDETFRVLSNNTLSRENLNNRSGAIRNIHYGDILTKFPEVLDCNKEEIPYVNDLSMLSSSTQLLQDGDIVVADTAEDETVGKVTEVQNLGDSKLVAGLHTIPCRVKKGDFAPGWLGYYMNSDLFHNQILPYITGIKVSSISKGAISETLILVPPFDEQEKIVQTLNEVQLLMTAETKVVNKIKFVKNGCLSKMFPQKDDPVPEMRLPGFTAAWEQRKLGELALFNPKDELPQTFEYVDLESVVGTEMLSHRTEVKSSAPSRAQRLAHTGDLFYQTVRPYQKNNYLFEKPDNNYVFSTGYAQMRPYVDGYFLLSLVQSERFVKVVLDNCTGTSYPAINANDLAEIEVAAPSDESEAQKIGTIFRSIDHLITLHQRKCDKYSNIKKGMMNDLLTGKIRLV